jgi:hypothetical protein
MVEFIILAFFLYMLAGSYTARQQYVIKQGEYLAIAGSEEARDERMTEIKDELSNMNHGICNMNYDGLKKRGCDCSKSRKWRKLHEELDALQEGGPVANAPGIQWGVIPAWPVVSYKAFMAPDVSRMIVQGEVEKISDEQPAQPGYAPEQFYKVLEDPWGHLRPNDTVAAKIRETWNAVYETYQSDLKQMIESGKSVHGIEYDESYAIMDDDGKVVHSYKFDPEPILVSADPKAQAVWRPVPPEPPRKTSAIRDGAKRKRMTQNMGYF